MITSKLEVLVDFGTNPDPSTLDRTLKALKSQDGVQDAVFKNGAIMVETTLPNKVVVDIVSQSSGKRSVLQGFGETQSAVAMVSGEHCSGRNAMGVIRFQQVGDTLLADGSVDHLTPGDHGVYVSDSGDLSEGCKSIGGHYNPGGTPHGAPTDPPESRHVGDLGNIRVGTDGRTDFRIISNGVKISDIIGRAIAITERPDDLGRGNNSNSKIDGNSGPPIACGIIARSAGIFQNPKRICLCDGVVVWDERDRPLAGKGRSQGQCCQGDKNKEQKTDQNEGKKPCCKV